MLLCHQLIKSMKQMKNTGVLLIATPFKNLTHSSIFYLVTTKELLVSIFEVLHPVQFAVLPAVAHHGVLLVVDAPHDPCTCPGPPWTRCHT